MLLWLSNWLALYYHVFHVFSYLTLRAILGALTALLLGLCLGPTVIRRLTLGAIGQVVRTDGPQTHLTKTGTPTMGGVLVIVAVVLSTLLWGDLTNSYVWLEIVTIVGFGLIGLQDDYRKLILKRSKGLSAREKIFYQSILGLGVAFYLYYTRTLPAQTELNFPFFKNAILQLGPWYVLLTYLVIVGASNAVNLTDGLDGLAIMPTVLIAAALGAFAYLAGHSYFATYLVIPYIPGSGELVVFCASLVGAGLGFLWFNTYPAQIFMGDVGALALGASLGLTAVIVRQEVAFFIMSGIFVVETLSVIIQVGSFKLTGKRVFRMAPIHHHFELLGWPEPRVIVRFWIITFVLVLCGLATLKLR